MNGANYLTKAMHKCMAFFLVMTGVRRRVSGSAVPGQAGLGEDMAGKRGAHFRAAEPAGERQVLDLSSAQTSEHVVVNDLVVPRRAGAVVAVIVAAHVVVPGEPVGVVVDPLAGAVGGLRPGLPRGVVVRRIRPP